MEAWWWHTTLLTLWTRGGEGGGVADGYIVIIVFRNKTAVLSLAHTQLPREHGPSSAVTVLCEWRVVTKEPQMGGRWEADGFHTVHGHPVGRLAPEKKITQAACVPVLMMEERQECSSWCHGNRLSGVV